ncbi:beta strand repeat-containing protein [Paraburkholderia elongata]|uniref:Head domain of trimeric autotransporter adhesin n=1 Tax=Paraburkholderia elongata TaxID=2675747 RepID=A0A972NHG3_9BURK|nr:YadA-like family protein [Paraburkholderia elongata]NPT53451.1 hypothetical protein [Paraburkholderia elongata]
MNKSYKNVWNETTGTYVAASEVAKSRGKSTRSQKALVTALLAAGVGFGTAVKAEAAATPNSFAAGILGTDTSNSDCISSADGAQVVTNGDCSAAAQQAGIVSYDGSGSAGAYFTVTDPNTAHIGAGGVDQMKITNNGVFVLNTLDMGGKKITNLAPGTVSASSTDAVNGAQLFGITNGSTVINSAYVKAIGKNDGTDAAVAPNFGSIAIGSSATVVATGGAGIDQIAIGDKAKAGNSGFTGAIAVGGSALATYDGAAFGLSSTATGNHSIALGAHAQATADNAVALGQGTVAARTSTVAVGGRQIVSVGAATQSTDAVNYAQLQAAGLKVDTSGNATNSFVAYSDTTQGKVTLAGAAGTTLTNVAAGVAATDAVNVSQLQSEDAKIDAAGENTATALGGGAAYSASTGAISAPTYNVAGGTQHDVGTALSSLNSATVQFNGTGGAADVQGKKIVNVAAGTLSASSTDAVNGAQLFGITNGSTVVNSAYVKVGGNGVGTDVATARGMYNVAIGAGAVSGTAGNSGAVSIGMNASSVYDGVTMGANASGTANYAVAIGAGSAASGVGSTALGKVAKATGTSDIALGYLASAAGDGTGGAVAIGAKANANATGVAIGGSASATAANSVAIGNNSTATIANTVSVGSSTQKRQIVNVAAGQQTTDAVNYGQLQAAGLKTDTNGNATNSFVAYDDTTQGKVTLGGASGTTLTNVAAGAVSESSKDAVNGAQLYSSATSTASALGGGSSVNADGTVSAPAYSVDNTTVNNVGAAISNIDGRVTKNTEAVDTLATKVDTINDQMTDVVKYDTSAHDTVTLAGASGTTLTNVAAGAVSESSTDAVNGSQLYATNQSVSKNADDIATLDTRVKTVEGSVDDLTKQLNTGTVGLVQQDATSGALSVASALGGTSFDFTGSAGPRQLLGVAAGKTATSAVNLGQLSPVVAALGGGAEINEDGTVSAPTYSVDNTTVNNVGAAISNIDGRVTQNTTDIDDINKQIKTLGGGVAGAVTYDTSVHDKVTLDGAAGTTLTNVAAGAVSESSKDAVNGAQLYSSATSTASALGGGSSVNADGTVSAPAYSVDNTTVNNVGAAISNIDGRVTKNTDLVDTLATKVGTINDQMTDVVKYDTSAHDTVKLAGASGTTLSNVKAGVDDMDAVNVGQLKAAGLTTDESGNATNSFVAYDDTTKDKISLGGGAAGTTLTNVAAGAVSESSTDAVNGSQLYATNQNVSKNADDIATVDKRVAKVEDSVGDLTTQLNAGTVGLVQQDQNTGALSVASTLGGTSFDFTGSAGPRQLLGVAAGTTSTSAVNLGQLSPVVAALGGGAQIGADGSFVSPTYHMQGETQTTVGDALDKLDTNLTSLETQINNGTIGMVTQDQTSRDILVGGATDGLRVNMAGTAGNRVVTGVAAGAVNEASVDAVNGSQLYSHAASTAAALGGGSTVNEDGTISAPAYTVGGTTVNNVGAAITNLDGRVTQNTNDIESLQTTVGSLSGSVANAVSYDTAAHNQVTLGGSADAPKVKLTNLQDGELSATSTDAVTGAQLWNTNQQLSDLSQSVQNQQETGSSAMSLNTAGAPAASASGNNAMALGGGSQASGDNSVAIGAGSVADQANTVSVGSEGNERRITNVAPGKTATDAVNLGQMQSAIGDTARAAYSGVAAATALTMIPEVDPGKTLAIGVAAATYKGYQAAAVGASARITSNVKVKVGSGISGSETTVGAGASYQW